MAFGVLGRGGEARPNSSCICRCCCRKTASSARLSACLFAGNLALQRRKKYSFVFILTRQLAIITNTFFPLFCLSLLLPPLVRWACRCDAKCLSLNRGKVASAVAVDERRRGRVRVRAELVFICIRIKSDCMDAA